MLTDLDFALYLNVAFFSMLGMGLLIGFLRGLKNAMWGFFVTLIFYVLFFLTLDTAVNFLWNVDMPFLGGLLNNLSPAFSEVKNLSEALPAAVGEYLGMNYVDIVNDPNVLPFVTAVALFVVKIVYMILYFTVIQIVYRLILWIVKMIIFPSKKKTDKYKSKNRGLGAVFGLMSGAISLYVTIIMFGGLMSIVGSVAAALPEDAPTMSEIQYSRNFQAANTSIIPMADIIGPFDTPEIQDAMTMINNMLDGYNNNVIVNLQNQVTMDSEYTGEPIPMNLYLFDSVLSINYVTSGPDGIAGNEDDISEQIAFREEINVYSSVVETVLSSDFIDTMDYADIDGATIRAAFTTLSESNLLTTVIPVAVLVGSAMFEAPVDIPTNELFDIEWDTELMQLGEIAATAFDIVNAAGILEANVDYDTITFDTEEIANVESLFTALGDSQLVTLAAYVAIEPLLEKVGGTIQAVITAPATVDDWSDEFKAIGEIAGAVLSAGLTIGDVQSQDLGAIMTVLSSFDFTVLLKSDIVTHAMINILSGDIEGFDQLNMIVIPSDLANFEDWVQYGTDGIANGGELYNILFALNQLTSQLSGLSFEDFQNFSLQTLADLDFDAITSIFESRILIATVTSFISTDMLGPDIPIVMPDTVFGDDGYILKTELENIVLAVGMIVNELACSIDDNPNCPEIGIDFYAALTLQGDDIDTMLDSEILSATVGKLIIDMGADVLTVPSSTLVSIDVADVATQVVNPVEIKNVFLAVSAIGITSFDNLTIDLSILSNLEDEANPGQLDPQKKTQLFGSTILNATLSSYIIDIAEPETGDAYLIVPYFDEDGDDVRVIDAVDGTEYITQTELTNVLEAVFVIVDLGIDDFTNVENLNLTDIFNNITTLLNSAILHATISNQLLGLTDFVTVPLRDPDQVYIQNTVGTDEQATTYIDKLELEAAFDALSVLGITNVNNIEFDVETLLNNLKITVDDHDELDTTKSDKLFGSAIINATLSSYIIDIAEPETGDGYIVVPYKNQANEVVRVVDDLDGTEYIVQTELTNILEGIISLGITDFNDISNFDLDALTTNMSTLLGSAILHATISDQFITLGSEVVTIPDSVVITTTGPEPETVYIDDTELNNIMDAFGVLGIDSIDGLGIDLSILGNLSQDPEDPVLSKELNTTNSNTIFASKIILATLSGYIIDFSIPSETTPEPFLVVPTADELGAVLVTDDTDTAVTVLDSEEVEYIDTDELNSLLSVILAFGLAAPDASFDDVADFSIADIMLHVDKVVASSIMQATISKQMIDLGEGLVVIPEFQPDQDSDPGNDVPILISVNGVQFIESTELEDTFYALDTLGIADINGAGVNMDFLNNLEDEANPGQLDDAKKNLLFDSTIIKATISSYIIDFSVPADELSDPILYVPIEDEDDVAIRYVFERDQTAYITDQELTDLLGAVLVLNLDDFGNVSTLDFSVVLANKETLLASTIIQATISNQLFTTLDGVVVIPETEDDYTTPVTISKGTGADKVDFIVYNELIDLFNAIDVLDILEGEGSGLSDFTGDFNFSVLSAEGAVATLVASAIIQATISDNILTMESDGGTATLIVVPDNSPDDTLLLKRTLDGYNATDPETPQSIQIIYHTEVENLVTAFVALGLTDVDSMGDAFTMGTLSDNAETIFESYVIQATFTNQVLPLESEMIVIPYYDDNPVELDRVRLRLASGPVGDETYFIEKNELINLMHALNELLGSDAGVDGFDGGQFDTSKLYDETSRAILLSSKILLASISKQVIDLGAAIDVPDFRDDTSTVVKFTVGTLVAEQSVYITETEIGNLFEALELFNFADFNEFDGAAIDFSIFLPSYGAGYDDNQNILLASACIQATVSSQIIGLGATIVVPDQDYDEFDVTVDVGLITYVYVPEIVALFNALDILNLDVNTFDGDIDLAALFPSNETYVGEADSNQTTILASAIMHATISDQIYNLSVGLEAPIILPGTDIDEGIYDKTVLTTYFISVSELKHLFNAIDVLGFGGNLGGFGGAIDMSLLADSGNQDILLDSIIMHATISDKIYSLSIGLTPKIMIPSTNAANVSIQTTTLSGDYYITDIEIKALLTAMDTLGIGGELTSFAGNIGLATLLKSNETYVGEAYDNQEAVLASAIMHRTITDQIVTLDGGGLTVPDTDIVGIAIDLTTLSGNYFIKAAQIEALIDAMDIILGDSGDTANLSGFNGGTDIDPSALGDPSSQTTLLLSAIMHATLSNQFLGTTLNVPDSDLDRAVSIRVTQSGTEFIEDIELKALLTALNLLGLDDFTSMNFNIDVIYTVNLSTLFESATMQSSISAELLANANSYAAATPGQFVVPLDLRSDISIGGVATVDKSKWMSETELIALINAFGAMELHGFNVSVGPTTMSGFDATKVHTIVQSASMHLTIEKMIKDNSFVNTYIPDVSPQLVIVDSYLSLSNIISVEEVEYFVNAVNLMGGNISGNIDISALNGLTLTQQETIITSRIVRAKMNDQIVVVMALHTPYTAADYETVDTPTPVCLKYDSAHQVLQYL